MLSLRKGMGALLLATLTLACILASPQTNAQKLYIRKINNWINWNGMFKPGTDSVQRWNVINDVASQIAAFSKKPVVDFKAKPGKITSSLREHIQKSKASFYITRITYQYCNNGDRLFWNITADAEIRALDSTQTQPGSTSPKPVVKPSGDLSFFAYNSKINLHRDSLVKSNGFSTLMSFAQPVQIDKNTVIAVLDTGIDTTLFEEGIRSELLWNGPSGSTNMVSGESANNYMDDYPNRHGTAVAGIALNSFYRTSNNTRLPKLMVVKVLNSRGEGTVFDLCCGINYAANNRATVINASLGYTFEDSGKITDESLEYCLARCHADSIPLVAAAGNTNEPRTDNSRVCANNTSGSNRMTTANMFLPAYYASDPNNFTVISVTGVRQPGISCYYQNFSEQFVTVAVLNQNAEPNCCSFKLPFLFDTVDGTSYATPVVSGRLAYRLSAMGHHNSIAEYMRQMNVVNAPITTGIMPVSQGNQYITY